MMQALWQPSDQDIATTNISAFIKYVNQTLKPLRLLNYQELYDWSIQQPADFWSVLWDYTSVVASNKGTEILVNGQAMPGARWFPDARLNYAENLLRLRDASPALIFRGEDQVYRRISHAELYAAVTRLATGMRAMGIVPGDRVAAYLPNMPQAIIGMLAAAAIGAVWSSSSPDFGVQGVLDRFGQIEPKLLLSADGYFYNGKRHDSLAKLKDIASQLPSLEKILIVNYSGQSFDTAELPQAQDFDSFIGQQNTPDNFEFAQLPFEHPLFIMFSSGTTGAPKCIIHGAGGSLLQHLKEHQLHTDIKPGMRLFYFTTCGWMMWNWLASGLASGATLMLYDGSPFYPDGNALFDYIDNDQINVFGTSAKYIDALHKADLKPRLTHQLDSLRSVLSTGSPLAPESFDFVYTDIKSDICLSSISGGTDILSCFTLGNPVLPVYRGQIQCRGLGMRVEVFNQQGQPVMGEKGELVCTAPFPSMPIGFWNDPDGQRYHLAYFDKYPHIWHHGDYVELTENGGLIIYGRSDAVLNPGGVRIGTAEIYRQAEKIDAVIESLVIGQDWQDDVRVVLFVRLRDGLELDDGLRLEIKMQIRKGATPRHVPAKIIQVQDIPRTKSGKIVELAVRDIVHGRQINNREALANPDALAEYAHIAELQQD